jgi:hypothetical protein
LLAIFKVIELNLLVFNLKYLIEGIVITLTLALSLPVALGIAAQIQTTNGARHRPLCTPGR